MEYKKVRFRVIPPFNKVEGFKIVNGGDILNIFTELVNLIVLRQLYYFTHIKIIGFLNKSILR
jgi:hypothetical protein